MVDLRDSQGRRWQISIGSEHAICDEQEVMNPTRLKSMPDPIVCGLTTDWLSSQGRR
ncbi:MAG: hypothetical protein Ct9H90mP16_07130 [Candidatus Poseidoniales archaeon]|nr:MAG: hypothetical protein Ct9H90mP16_07130 [Candidatus Poseidoniales archaeon]